MSRFRKIIFSLAIIMYCFPVIGYASDNLETEIVIKYNENITEAKYQGILYKSIQ